VKLSNNASQQVPTAVKIPLILKTRLLSSLKRTKPPAILTWAEQNIVLPDGPHRGLSFDSLRQPFTRLFLKELDSGRWDKIVAVGPTQTGKSLICYVIPVLYHLFGIGETVVAGIPTADMADDKWSMDFLPVIEASPVLREWLPKSGPGARAGKVRTLVKFANGAKLRFMSFGGDDKSVAGFTSRVLAVTEVDGVDKTSETSKEADKLKQLEGRLRAFLAFGIREYLECTVSTSTGKIWSQYQAATRSRIARPCPHCGEYVTPEREHLIGWQEAENELEARERAAWTCPHCKATWTERERYEANLRSILVHHGQEVTAQGEITGPAPPTRNLGFRWSAVDNHFATAADVAADEWNASREFDRENAEKQMRQFVHCLPYDPPDIELTPLDPDAIRQRTGDTKKGIVPKNAIGITVGVDTGKRHLHWAAIAWLPDGGGKIIDYGVQTVEADKRGIKESLLAALRSLAVYFGRGWTCEAGGENRREDGRMYPAQVWIDSGWHEHTEAVYEFCREENDSQNIAYGKEKYRPSKGYGENQRRMARYYAPQKLNAEVRFIGIGYHLSRVRGRVLLVHVNSDHWKSELHSRLSLPKDGQLAITLYEAADREEHREFAEQLTAERQLEKFDDQRGRPDPRGERIVWERIRRQNHFLDATYQATAAGHFYLTLKNTETKAPASGQWFANQSRR
jgi:phage terminase large subunit GpA-like protein